jgi:hypothetical protein
MLEIFCSIRLSSPSLYFCLVGNRAVESKDMNKEVEQFESTLIIIRDSRRIMADTNARMNVAGENFSGRLRTGQGLSNCSR